MHIGEKIKILRSKKEITQRIIAKHLGVAVNTYSQYENNLRNPDYDILKKISIYFEVPIDYFLNEYVQDDELEYMKYLINKHYDIIIEAKYVMSILWDIIHGKIKDDNLFTKQRKRLSKLFMDYQESMNVVGDFLLNSDIEDEMIELLK